MTNQEQENQEQANQDLNQEPVTGEAVSEPTPADAAAETPAAPVNAPKAARVVHTPGQPLAPAQGRDARGPRGGGGGGPRRGGPGGPGGPGGQGGPGGRQGGRPGQGRAPEADDAERSEWREKVIQIRRVTKVVKGGKKLSFRAVVVVGNGKGQVGIGVGKSNEVIGAIQKAVTAAKKTLITVPIHKTTIPHPVKTKAGGSVVVLLPASEGTGVIAGGAARALLELAGVENILSKSLGSNSPLNVARATLKGLAELRTFEAIAKSRGKTVREILL